MQYRHIKRNTLIIIQQVYNNTDKERAMSFAGFVFDMIRRDKENRDLRNLRRERFNERSGKMYRGRAGMPRNTTAEDMEKIAGLIRKKEQTEQRHTLRMTLVILGICLITATILVFIFIR